MNNTEAVITLSIKETPSDDPRVFLFHIQVDGQVIAANQSLSPDASEAVRELSEQYNTLFEKHHAPGLVANNLRAFGRQLFDTWLASVWPAIKAQLQPGARRVLVIASEVPEILNLPWELISADDGNFIGLDAKFTVRRLPKKDAHLAPANKTLPPRPLRLLFMACAPREEAQLEFEREEEAIIRAIAQAGTNVAFDSGDAGTFDELLERINEFQPHVVHLTGHGVVKDGLGYFAFEDERGQTDPRSSVEMRQRLFSGSGVQLAFISGCQTGKAPPIAAMGGICQGLVSEEIPMAIGWAASIADDIATQFAATFYKTLVSGQPVDRALTLARQAIQKVCDDRSYPGWTLPVLYSATTQAMVFDTDPQRKPVPPLRPSVVQQPLEGIQEGYTDHFVGRRRELQRLLPALREGTLHTLMLTGLGGAGKSTLATRLARKLEADGFTLIPVSSTKEVPLSAARLLAACGDAFLKLKLRDEYQMLNDPNISVEARLRFIVSTLNAHRFLLVLDNFEVNLDDETRRILDSSVAEFYKHLLASLVGTSRAIITCRYLPADAKLPPMTAREEALSDFPESSFMKFMLRDAELERRYYAGELPRELLSKLHGLLGGTPRFLGQMREAIKTMTADELRIELQKVKLTVGAEAGVLQRERDKYCETIFTARLYGYLNEESQRALSRAAVYSVAVSPEGLVAVTGVGIDEVRRLLREWQNYALIYPDTERGADDLWSVYGLLRNWLLSRMNDDERRKTHHAAGNFLCEIEEQDRASELGLSWIECLTEARAQYLDAGEYAQAREATSRISVFLVRQGLYKDLERINREALDYEEHPTPMGWIGRSYDDRGNYPLAREWYQRSLTAAGDDLLKEASDAWHGLALIDLNVGDYEAARAKFQMSLTITQQTGNRAGENTAWHNLASIDLNVGDYEAARTKLQTVLIIRQQIGDRIGEAATWHELGRIDLEVGDYEAARTKFQTSLSINQQIGNRAVEAKTWHQLASIDVEVGDYKAARAKFQTSLAIKQQIGDRAGEAATFYQLGIVAARSGRLAEGTRLVALSFLILQSIGHTNVKHPIQALSQMAAQLNYTQEQVEAMLREISEAYKADRGAGLIQAAFGKV